MSLREKYPSEKYPFSDELCLFFDKHPEFYHSLKLYNEKRFVFIPLIFTSHLPSTEKEASDEVIGMWYFDKESIGDDSRPQFKQDFIINVNSENKQFHSYVDRNTCTNNPSPFVHLISDFFRKYGKNGCFYNRNHPKPWMHHYLNLEELPDEVDLKRLADKCMKKETFDQNLEVLKKETIELETTYCLWEEMVRDLPSKIDIYNIAPGFFQIAVFALYEQTIIGLGRYFDKDSNSLTLMTLLTSARENSMEIFPQEVDQKELHEQIDKDLKELGGFKEHTNILNYRHWRIAHLDLKTANNLQSFLKQFPITKKDFRETLDLIEKILNHYLAFTKDTTQVFEAIGAIGSLTVVMDYLEKYKRLQKDFLDNKLPDLRDKSSNWEVLDRYF